MSAHAAAAAPVPATASRSGPLSGRLRPPGDKSISHRALILGGLALGTTTVTGLLEGDDVLCTAAAMAAMGATTRRRVDASGAAVWEIDGVGVGGLAEPSQVLDMGNSGTACRLLMGTVAGHPITAFFTGDASLSRRPMARVSVPLIAMGASVLARQGKLLPLAVTGRDDLLPIEYLMPVASAQVKSAILLAALNTAGTTTVIEPRPSRNHSEVMLRQFGCRVQEVLLEDGRMAVSLTGQAKLEAQAVTVPADPSSAAFAMVAALIVPGSELVLEQVGLNPGRIGLIETLIEMGGDITVVPDAANPGGEPTGTVTVRHSALKGVTVPAERAPRMIDEYPVLAVAAAFAEGRTVMAGLEELVVKESDRLGSTAAGLKANGVACTVEGHSLTVEGGAGHVAGGGLVVTHFDHRLAMAFLVMGLASAAPVRVDDTRAIATSYPAFMQHMAGIGATIAVA